VLTQIGASIKGFVAIANFPQLWEIRESVAGLETYERGPELRPKGGVPDDAERACWEGPLVRVVHEPA
jgi:hypothetical protein